MNDRLLGWAVATLLATSCAHPEEDCAPPADARIPPTAAMRSAGQSANVLGIALVRGTGAENRVVAAVSVLTALGMVYAGAAGATREEMRAALQLTTPRSSRWAARRGSMGSGRSLLVMPRFEARARLSLGAALMALGMPSAFDPASADLSALAPAPDQVGNVSLSVVTHEAWIRVEESDSATDAGGGAEASTGGTEIRADRPFAYLIRDRVAGTSLLVGRVDDP